MASEQEQLGREIIGLKKHYPSKTASERADLVFAYRVEARREEPPKQGVERLYTSRPSDRLARRAKEGE